MLLLFVCTDGVALQPYVLLRTVGSVIKRSAGNVVYNVSSDMLLSNKITAINIDMVRAILNVPLVSPILVE